MTFRNSLLRLFPAGLASLAMAPASPAHAEVKCADHHWDAHIKPGPQQTELIERIALDGKQILAFRLAPLAGDYAKLFMMVLDNGHCFEKVATVGAYQVTQEPLKKALADQGIEATQVFHADLYDGDQHRTLGVFGPGEPRYEVARKLLLDALK